MYRRSFFRLCVLLAGLGLVVASTAAGARQHEDRRGRKYKAPPPASRIVVNVLRASDDKPIANAAVIFHPIEGDRDKGELELKTNGDGQAVIDVLPIGDTVRLQIIADGFKTYGQDFQNDKNDLTFDIKMKRPGEQYSIYQPHSSSDKPGNGSGTNDGNKGQTQGSGSQPESKSK